MFLFFAILIIFQNKGGVEATATAVATERIEEYKPFRVIDPEAFKPVDELLSQERYMFDKGLVITVDQLTTPSISLRSRYIRIPVIPRLLQQRVFFFLPKFDKSINVWKLTIRNSQGKVIWEYAGRGQPPSYIEWDGRKMDGSMIIAGEPYTFVFEAFDLLGNKSEIIGEPFKIKGFVYREPGEWIIDVDAREIFKPKTTEFTPLAPDYLQEIINFIKDHFKEEVVIGAYADPEILSERRAKIVADYIKKYVPAKPGAIQSEGKYFPGGVPHYERIVIRVK